MICNNNFVSCNICSKILLKWAFLHSNVTSFKQMRYKVSEATTPREPLVMSARRDIEIGVDSLFAETLHQGFGAEILLRAAAQIEVMHLLVELIGTGKDSVVGRLHIESEDGSAEGAHVGELVQIGQDDVESLVSAP